MNSAASCRAARCLLFVRWDGRAITQGRLDRCGEVSRKIEGRTVGGCLPDEPQVPAAAAFRARSKSISRPEYGRKDGTDDRASFRSDFPTIYQWLIEGLGSLSHAFISSAAMGHLQTEMIVGGENQGVVNGLSVIRDTPRVVIFRMRGAGRAHGTPDRS